MDVSLISVFAQPRHQWKDGLSKRTWLELRDIDFPYLLQKKHQTGMIKFIDEMNQVWGKEFNRDASVLAHHIEQAGRWPSPKWDNIWLYLLDPPRKIRHNSLKYRPHEKKSLFADAWLGQSPYKDLFPEEWGDQAHLSKLKSSLIEAFSAHGGRGLDRILNTNNPSSFVLCEKALLQYKNDLKTSTMTFYLWADHRLFGTIMQERAPFYCQKKLEIFGERMLYVGGLRTTFFQKAKDKIKRVSLNPFFPGYIAQGTIPQDQACQFFDRMVKNNHFCFTSQNWLAVERFFNIAQEKDLSCHMPFVRGHMEHKNITQAVGKVVEDKHTAKRKM